MNQAIHSVDLLTWLMGPVVEVRPTRPRWPTSGSRSKTSRVATLKFANGALGVIEASTAAYPGYLKRIEIHGSEGTRRRWRKKTSKLGTSPRSRSATRRSTQQMAQRTSTGGGASDPAAIGHHGHAQQFADVVDAIKKNRTPGDRRPRRPPLGRDHSGHLQSGRNRQSRQVAAEKRSHAGRAKAG